MCIDNNYDDKILLCIFSTVNAVDYLFGNTTNISLNQWHHIAGTFNAGQAKVYLDGNLDNSKTMSVSSIMNDAHPLTIGGHWKYCDGQPNFYSRLNGAIDDVRIYDRALSAEQIQTLMHTRPASGEPNLVGYWDFDEGEEQLAGDSSGNYNDGTLGSTGGVDDSDPNWTDSIPPVGICSLEGLVGRNISNVLDIKADILDLLDIALGKEEALFDYMDEAFHNGELDNLNKNDVVQAKQKLHSAIQAEIQAENAVDHSVNKLDDALDALGIDPTSWHQSEIEEEILRADINADGVIDFRDFTILTEHWLKYYGP